MPSDLRPTPTTLSRYVESPTSKGTVFHVKWQCLPDTVDPRSPKGK